MAKSRLQREEDDRVEEIKGFLEFALSILKEERGLNDRDVSRVTGLCVGTLIRLRYGRVSSCVRFGTMQKLAKAAGVSIRMEKEKVVIAGRVGQVSGSRRKSAVSAG